MRLIVPATLYLLILDFFFDFLLKKKHKKRKRKQITQNPCKQNKRCLKHPPSVISWLKVHNITARVNYTQHIHTTNCVYRFNGREEEMCARVSSSLFHFNSRIIGFINHCQRCGVCLRVCSLRRRYDLR